MRWLAVAGALAGCTSFENPEIVVDLRVLAMTATHPEQVVDVDLANPPEPADLLAQLVPTRVCALVADPGEVRRVRYQFTLCAFGAGSRCDPDNEVPMSTGSIPDPEAATPAQTEMCGDVLPNGNLLGVLLATGQGDPLASLGGLDYLVQLQVGGEDDPLARDEYAAKTLRVSPRLPAGRTPNQNPTLDRIDVTLAGYEPTPLQLGRCTEQTAPLEVAPGTRLELTPIEPAGARETYAVPTIDGKFQTFTESLTYQWIASAGNFTSGSTGGPRDLVGNYPELFTEWRAPRAADVGAPTNVQLWIVQRDERYGVTWFESCIRVVP